MLKRLIVLAAALAMVFVFVSTSSAQSARDQYGGEAYDAGYGYDVGYDEGVPKGGVPSGFGPTDSAAAGAPLVARGAALLAVLGVLGTGLLIVRRRHGS
jgi:uncharacterized membrane protein